MRLCYSLRQETPISIARGHLFSSVDLKKPQPARVGSDRNRNCGISNGYGSGQTRATPCVLKLASEILGFFGRDGRWRVEPGRFQVWIAPHAQTGTPANYDL
jgi:hypothetical protein